MGGLKVLLLVALGLAIAPAATADNCSTPDDCEQTANYNTAIAVGGGVLAAIIGGVVSTLSPGAPPQLRPPGPSGPSAPLVDPYTGKPMTVHDGTNGGGGKKGDLWWPWGGGRWVSPDEARRIVRETQDELGQDKVVRDKRWTEMRQENEKEFAQRIDTLQHEADRERVDREAREAAALNESRRHKRLEELRSEAEDVRQKQEEANSWGGWARNVNEEFWDRTERDLTGLPKDLQRAGRSLLNLTTDAVREAGKPENWRILAETGRDTFGDVLRLAAGDKRTYDKHLPTYEAVTGTGKAIIKKASEDPIDFVKGLTPIKQWQDAMDPEKPLSQRIWKTWMATLDTAFVVQGVRHKLGSGLRLDSQADAVRKGLRQKALPGKRTMGELQVALDEEQAARALAQKHINDYEKVVKEAEKAARARDAAVLEAALEKQRLAALRIQSSKEALQDMGRRTGRTIKNFNNDMRTIYEKTDQTMVRWAAREHGLEDLQDLGMRDGVRVFRDKNGVELHIAEPTNPGGKLKAPADRDMTMRLKRPGEEAVDLPAAHVQRHYSQAFYHASGGDDAARALGMPPNAHAFTEKMDQVCTDRLHMESYGTPKDLTTAVSEPGRAFGDAPLVAKAVQVKGDHWLAHGNTFEGTRQTVKQFENQAMARFRATSAHVERLQEAGKLPKSFVVKPPDPQLTEAMDILKKVHGPERMPVAVAEQRLRQIGMTPQDAGRRVGEYIDGLQRTANKALRGAMESA